MADEPVFKSYSVSDLMNLPPEKAESAYRRGFRDGWVQAIDALHDLMFEAGMSRQAAYAKAWDHWENALLEWEKKHGEGFDLPPGLE